MDLAFELAESGRGLTHPNPRVGAVVVAGGEVVGRGYHRGPGTPHAEAEALARGGREGARRHPLLHPGAVRPPRTHAALRRRHRGGRRDARGGRSAGPKPAGRRPRLCASASGRRAGRRARRARRRSGRRASTLPSSRPSSTGLPLVTYKAAVSLDGKVAAGRRPPCAAQRAREPAAWCTACAPKPMRCSSAPARCAPMTRG